MITALQEEHDITISGITEHNKQKFKVEVCDKYCDSLAEHLEKRFPDLSLIKAFQLFHPQLISSSEVEVYGSDFISELSRHY